MRDLFRPARRVGGGNGTKFSLLAQNGSKSGFWGVLGEFCTGWAADPGRQGDVCCPARPDVGASVKELALRAHNGQKLAFDGALGEFFADQQSWDPAGRVVLRRGPGSRVLLLAPLTRSCAAKPH